MSSIATMPSNILYKHRNNRITTGLIRKILGIDRPRITNTSLLESLTQLSRNMKPPRPFDPQARIDARLRDLEIIPDSFEVKNYLDVGCGDGLLTEAVGHYFQAQTYGTDIENWQDNADTILGKITFFPANEAWPVKNIDLVTAFQVLHHIPDVEATLDQIYQVMQPDGLLLIREHDCPNQEFQDLIDIEHLLWLVHSNTLDQVPNYFAHCRSKSEWTKLLEKHGFELLTTTTPYGLTSYYYGLYKKVDKD